MPSQFVVSECEVPWATDLARPIYEAGGARKSRNKSQQSRRKENTEAKKQNKETANIHIYIYHIMTIRKNTYTLYAEYIDHIEHH